MKISPAKYQETILESMARTLWVMAYANWVENLDEEQVDGLEYQVIEVIEPDDGEDWMDVAPPTPLAAVYAARELRDLIMVDNGVLMNTVLGRVSSGTWMGKEIYGLYDLFVLAMEVDAGRPFPSYDEPWHSQIEAEPGDVDLISVYADWLEEQGREKDAAIVRKAKTGAGVTNFMGGLDAATQFGHDIAMECLGTGAAWSDDHVVKRGDLVFDPVIPSFECNYDGEALSWSGRARDAEARPSTKSAMQTARYQGDEKPLAEALGDDISSAGRRQLNYLNERDRAWTRHCYVLWAEGAGYFVIYANALDDALDEMGDWLRDNAPGVLATEYVNEEYQRLEKEWLAENEGVELTDEQRWQLMEEAEIDTTPLGSYGDRINSDAWGILAEDPSDVELLKIAGLIANPAYKPRTLTPNPKNPQSPYDALATVMFRNTVTARMLRSLAARGRMTQGEFMQEYMRRCERETRLPRYRVDVPEGGWSSKELFSMGYAGWTPGEKALFSGFNNNFGRYVAHGPAGSGFWAEWFSSGETRNMSQYEGRWGWQGVIRKESLQKKSGDPSSRNLLRWVGPDPETLLSNMSIAKLDWAYANLEQQLVDKARPTDDPVETQRWIERIQQHLHRTPVKTNPLHVGRPSRSKVTHAHHPVPRKR